jgi:T-complex protein 1 subunit eta
MMCCYLGDRAALWSTFEQTPNSLQVISANGGSLLDSVIFRGVCFERPFVYAGYALLPKRIEHPRILLLNCELELKRQTKHVEIVATSSRQYKEFVDTEVDIFFETLEKIALTGCNIVISSKCIVILFVCVCVCVCVCVIVCIYQFFSLLFLLPAIGDFATQYFAEKRIWCAGRVPLKIVHLLSHSLGQ